MKCPKCNSEVRPSKKYPGYYLCDTCRKRYPEASVIDDEPEDADEFFDDDDYDDYNHSDDSGIYDFCMSASDLNDDIDIPQKSAKKKGHLWKFLLGILILLILLAVILAGAMHLGYIKADRLLPGSSNKSGTVQDDSPEASDTQTLYKTGDIATINNVQIQVLGYEESVGDEWSAPAEDNEFVFVNIEITNNTEEDLTVSSMASFESYCGDYKLDYSPEAFTALATNTDKQQMDGTIASGKVLNGYLCLEVPSDWETLEIHYSDNVWASEKVQFEITR